MSLPISIGSKKSKFIMDNEYYTKKVQPITMHKQVKMNDTIQYMIQELNEADQLVLFPNMDTIQVPRFGVIYKYKNACGRVGIIDLEFGEKFKTPYVSIVDIPNVFHGYIKDYKTIVNMLSEQLKKEFTQENIFLGPHRKQLYTFLTNIS